MRVFTTLDLAAHHGVPGLLGRLVPAFRRLAGVCGDRMDARLFAGIPERAFSFSALVETTSARGSQQALPAPRVALLIDLAVLGDCVDDDDPRPLPVGSAALLERFADWMEAPSSPGDFFDASVSPEQLCEWCVLTTLIAVRIVAAALRAAGEVAESVELMELVSVDDAPALEPN